MDTLQHTREHKDMACAGGKSLDRGKCCNWTEAVVSWVTQHRQDPEIQFT